MSTGLSRVVFTKIGGLLQQNSGLEVQKFECRLRKSKKGGKPPSGEELKKYYGKTVRVPRLYDVDYPCLTGVPLVCHRKLCHHQHSRECRTVQQSVQR